MMKGDVYILFLSFLLGIGQDASIGYLRCDSTHCGVGHSLSVYLDLRCCCYFEALSALVVDAHR